MDPSEGYKEARKLLEKEYGDHFKVSMPYVNKFLKWSLIQTEDAPAVKHLSFTSQVQKYYDERVSHE